MYAEDAAILTYALPALAGRSAASIARDLTQRGVMCPSQADFERNRHRTCEEWSLRAVIEILGNPRYTGRQVWNRTSVDRSRRRVSTRRHARTRIGAGQWVVSAAETHPALASEEDFVAAQGARVARTTVDGTVRLYRLSGLVRCGVCERRMEAHHVHGLAGNRCRHGYRSSRIRPADVPRNVYVREDHLIDLVRNHLQGDGYQVGAQPDDVVTLLGVNGLLIVCTSDSATLVLAGDATTSPSVETCS
jgi:site-specific DNA recombinase